MPAAGGARHAASLAAAATGGARIGTDLVLGTVLGVGGFAITYEAKDLTLDLPVAVKEYFPAIWARRAGDGTVHPASESAAKEFESAKALFSREAQLLARFKHKNIVSVYRVVPANGTAYTVMELIAGEDLEDYLRKLGKPPSQEQLDLLIAPLLEALEQVHGAGVVHRDIKPQNIRIRASDREPVLIDFGAADIYASTDNATLGSGITVGFAPIETYQDDFSRQGPWSDIYGLAATVHRALRGAPPAQAPQRAISDSHRPLARDPQFAAYRKDFLAAIDWGLALRPNDRPRSVAEWRERLMPQSTRFKVQQRRRVRGTKVFVSYRRSDSAHVAGRIYDRLCATFGDDKVFFDVDAIPAGVDFRSHIERSIEDSAVLVAVIGKQWVNDAWRGKRKWLGLRRAHSDYVQVELELAVEHGLTILPLLVDGVEMPGAAQLPETFREIAYLNATMVRAGKDFRKDIAQVEDTIRRVCEGL